MATIVTEKNTYHKETNVAKSQKALIGIIDTLLTGLRALFLVALLAITYMLVSNTFFADWPSLTDPQAAQSEVTSLESANQPSLIANEFDLTPYSADLATTAASNEPGTILGPDWLLAQAQGTYVVQIKSSENYAALAQYADRYVGTTPLAIYPFKISRNNQLIYGLSYGIYDDYRSAQAGFDALAPELRRDEPWIREASSLATTTNSLP